MEAVRIPHVDFDVEFVFRSSFSGSHVEFDLDDNGDLEFPIYMWM